MRTKNRSGEMDKQMFGTIIPEDLDKEFREKVEKLGKKYNLALEEAMKLWIEESQKRHNSSEKKKVNS